MRTTFHPVNGSVKSAGWGLERVGGVERPQGLADPSRDLAIPRNSALVLPRTLQRRGYVSRDGSERHALVAPLGGVEGDWVGGPPARLLRAVRPVIAALVAGRARR